MKLLGHVLLVFGVVLSGLLAIFLFLPDSYMSWGKAIAIVMLPLVAAMAGLVITIWQAFLKDEYPELLLQAHRQGWVYEGGDVKMVIMGSGSDIPRGGLLDMPVLVENTTTAPREVTLHLTLLTRLALKQTGNLTYPKKVVFLLGDGEVAIVHIPLNIDREASTGRYIIQTLISARALAKGRRVRRREARTASPAGHAIVSLSAIFHPHDVTGPSFVFHVKDVLPGISTTTVAPPPEEQEFRVERYWQPGDVNAAPLVFPVSYRLRDRLKYLAIVVLLYGVGIAGLVSVAMNGDLEWRSRTTEGKILKLEETREHVSHSSSVSYHIKYSYALDGHTFEGVEDQLYHRPPEPLTVYYDPAKPSHSQLREPSLASSLISAFILFGLGTLAWYKWLRKPRES